MSVAGDILLSIRDQIPDRVPGDDPAVDGKAYSVKSLLRWINDAGRMLCLRVPVIQDWYAIPSTLGQDVYILPNYITSVEQLWYDLKPCQRSAEGDDIYISKVQGNSWWFGPHSLHATPRLNVWPAPSRTAGTSTLNGSVAIGATSLVTSTAVTSLGFGFIQLGTGSTAEIVRYATISSDNLTLSNLLKGQGGTVDTAWANATTVTETNIMFKCFRLPVPLVAVTDTVEIPQPLWPLLELYVLSKVRASEQDDDGALKMRQFFDQSCEQLGSKAQLKGLRQGIQVKTYPYGPDLWMGRLFIK